MSAVPASASTSAPTYRNTSLGANPADVVEASDIDSVRAELATMLAALYPAWHERAECRDEPLRSFYPERGESAKAAYQLCGRCDVRDDCLAEAIADPMLDFGVRGGLSVQARKQRRALAAKQTRTGRERAR